MGIYFIGGSMRSGTNLMQRILCGAQSTQARLEEAGYLTGLMETYIREVGEFPERTLQYFKDMNAVKGFQREVLRTFMQAVHAAHPEAVDLVMKKPELTRCFPELADLLPEARFVVMMRDPRDAIASMMSVGRKQAALGKTTLLVRLGRNIPALCAHFASFYGRLWPAISDGSLNGRLLFVRYEDLVTAPAQAVDRVTAFTGLQLSADSLATQTERADGGPTPFKTALTGRGISDRSVARHTAELSLKEQQAIEQTLGDLLQIFHYPAQSAAPEETDCAQAAAL